MTCDFTVFFNGGDFTVSSTEDSKATLPTETPEINKEQPRFLVVDVDEWVHCVEE